MFHEQALHAGIPPHLTTTPVSCHLGLLLHQDSNHGIDEVQFSSIMCHFQLLVPTLLQALWERGVLGCQIWTLVNSVRMMYHILVFWEISREVGVLKQDTRVIYLVRLGYVRCYYCLVGKSIPAIKLSLF